MSYSHPITKQDLWVMDILGGGPFEFLELGAYDGVTHSNTLLLEENGWMGTLIEGHHEHAEWCRKNRPNTKVIEAVIGDGREDYMVVGGQYTGLISTMPADFMVEHDRRNNKTYPVKTVPLTSLGIWHVDYFSLDTEGNEFEILKDWFEFGCFCELLTVEFRYDMSELKRLEWLCRDYGYRLDEVRGFDACFCKT